MTNALNTSGIDNIDLKLLSSFSKSNFKAVIKKSLLKSLRGKSRLKGSGDLVPLWPYCEKEANEQGLIAVIYKGGEMLMVDAVSYTDEKDGTKKANYFVSKNPYKKYTTLTIKVPAVVNGKQTSETVDEIYWADVKTAEAMDGDKSRLFAVLENDVDLSPSLVGIDEDLAKLEVILDAIWHDIVISKKKIYFVFPQDPDPEDWKKAGLLWDKGIMGYIAMPRSAKPNAKEGKAGIDPNNIQLQVYQPENKGRDLWSDYRNWMREVLWKHGIRFDVLEDKKERAPVAEVSQSTSYFDDLENENRQCRENFFKWVIKNWGDKALAVDYTFTYGKRN
ncbi:MAG: hypothetical protein MRERV_9c069 [Mycoplasmataceae bacterium RV_VA103A]|nr:MAG: hypothetical protein MRERV_9c069 [Mycoplasmataceae bacterium RV_VA103A]